MQHYIDAFHNFADFHGRSTRTQYWMFVLFNIIFSIATSIIDLIIFGIPVGIASLLYALVITIPSLSIAVRRLHDSGRSGYMIFLLLIPIIGAIWILVLLLAPSEKEDNAYGDYYPEVLDAEIQTQQGNPRKVDNAIIIFLCWMLFESLFWRIAPFLGINTFYGNSYMAILILRALISGAVAVNLAVALKNDSKRITGLVVAILFLLFELYRAYEIYWQFIDIRYVPY